MRKILSVIVISFLLFSCSSNSSKEKGSGKKAITVSILPEKTFVEKIAGDDFDINVLIPPGVTPEAGNLLPSQLKDIANSVIWFRMGHIGFEYSWKDKIEEANPNMKVVDLSEGLDLISEKEERGGQIQETGVDPHIWLSPGLVKQMAEKIMNELSLYNPEKSAEYKVNYMKFVKEIDQLNIDIKNQLKDYKGREIILFHPSLSYYARDYGLIQQSLEPGGKEPTPQHMAEVVEIAKAKNIKVIYIQSEFDREHARVFAEEINGKVVPVSPLDPNWEENLRYITQVIVDNF